MRQDQADQQRADWASSKDAPLHGMRILEVAPPSAGAICRYLAELGADVILVPQSDAHADELLALVSNTSKRVMNFDLANAADRSRLLDLAADADLLVLSTLDPEIGLALEKAEIASLRARNPKLVVLAVTPFGQDGRYASWQLTSSVADALSGVLSRSGFPEKDPLLPPARISFECAFAQAAWIAVLAYFNRLRTGKGDFVDLSLMEAAAQSMDPGYGMAGSATVGVPTSQLPRSRPEGRHQYPIIACKDGHVRICILAARQWQGMFRWLGGPEKYADPKFNTMYVRFQTPSILEDIAALFADRTRAELEAEAGRFGVPIAPILSLDEALQTEQVKARGSLAQVWNTAGRLITVPNGVFEIDGRRAAVRGAPQVVSSEASWLSDDRFDPPADDVAPDRPLSGFTVLDLGVIVAGAEQTRLLADQGALTLKVEASAFPDGGRQSREGYIVSVNFAMGHRNKKGLGLNLRQERGREILVDLVRQSDIFMSNFRPGTLASLKLDYPVLSQANPAIVMVDSSAYGTTGPWNGRPGYGPLVRASSGLTKQWAYPDTVGEFSDAMTVYPDHISGRCGAIAAVALLIRRIRTGTGGEASMSQAEIITAHLGDQVAALSLGEDRPARSDAPWGVYRCAGDDEWCVVTVRNNRDWRALAMVLDREDLLADVELGTAEGRINRRAELDLIVEHWTSLRLPDEAMTTLQAAGVPSGKMLRVFEMPDFGFFQERGTYEETGHPLLPGAFKMESSLARSELIRSPDFVPAPVPGEHSAWIASTLLGLGHAEIGDLIGQGVLEVYRTPA